MRLRCLSVHQSVHTAGVNFIAWSTMHRNSFYNSPAWQLVRERVKRRDRNRCTVGRLLGGSCSGTLHVHHIEPLEDRPDLALIESNLATVCATHHPTWEAMRRYVESSRRPIPPCKHRHPYKAGRIQCARERAKKLGIVVHSDAEIERLIAA